jgi:hypothetical protein
MARVYPFNLMSLGILAHEVKWIHPSHLNNAQGEKGRCLVHPHPLLRCSKNQHGHGKRQITTAFSSTTPDGVGHVLVRESSELSQPLVLNPKEIRSTACTELATTQTESEIHLVIAIVMISSSMVAGMFFATATSFCILASRVTAWCQRFRGIERSDQCHKTHMQNKK